jgi:hypothetical protein
MTTPSPDVLIICEHPSHGGKTVTIEQMVHDGRWWIGMGIVSLEARRANPNSAPSRTWSAEQDEAGSAYLKHRWSCACGLDVKARGERADPIFDKLAANGVGSISLQSLASKVSSD